MIRVLRRPYSNGYQAQRVASAVAQSNRPIQTQIHPLPHETRLVCYMHHTPLSSSCSVWYGVMADYWGPFDTDQSFTIELEYRLQSSWMYAPSTGVGIKDFQLWTQRKTTAGDYYADQIVIPRDIVGTRVTIASLPCANLCDEHKVFTKFITYAHRIALLYVCYARAICLWYGYPWHIDTRCMPRRFQQYRLLVV